MLALLPLPGESIRGADTYDEQLSDDQISLHHISSFDMAADVGFRPRSLITCKGSRIALLDEDGRKLRLYDVSFCDVYRLPYPAVHRNFVANCMTKKLAMS